jgi:hypothetical protein
VTTDKGNTGTLSDQLHLQYVVPATSRLGFGQKQMIRRGAVRHQRDIRIGFLPRTGPQFYRKTMVNPWWRAMRRIHKAQRKNQNRLHYFFWRQKFLDRQERRSRQISIEPVGDVLDGGVAIERPLHGDSGFWCSLSLEHPLCSLVEEREREREREREGGVVGSVGPLNGGL